MTTLFVKSFNDFEDGPTIQSAGELQKFAKQKKLWHFYCKNMHKNCLFNQKKKLIFINEIFPLWSNLNSNSEEFFYYIL